MKGKPRDPFPPLGNNKHASASRGPSEIAEIAASNSNCTLEFLIIEIINQNVPSARRP